MGQGLSRGGVGMGRGLDSGGAGSPLEGQQVHAPRSPVGVHTCWAAGPLRVVAVVMVGSVVGVVVGVVAEGWWVGVRVRTWRANRCVHLPALQVRAPAGPSGGRTCWASQSGYLNLKITGSSSLYNHMIMILFPLLAVIKF